MTQVIIEVEIPDGWELADTKFRLPKCGEWYIINDCEPFQAAFDYTEEKGIIVRRKWQWPEWLKADSIARSGIFWYAYMGVPIWDGKFWYYGGLKSHQWILNECFCHIEFPNIKEDRDTLIKNPNIKE